MQANSVQCTVCKNLIHNRCRGVYGDLSLVADGFRFKRSDGTIQETDLAEDLVVDGEGYYYYQFIVRFPIWLDFLFITFLLHFFLSWTSSLSISNATISASTPCPSWSSAFNSKPHTFLHPILITCPCPLSLPLLMTAVIGSTPTSLLNSSVVFHGDTTPPSNHMHLCSFKL